MHQPTTKVPPSSKEAIVTKALRRAAEQLGLSQSHLASIIGLSNATTSRMFNDQYSLNLDGKEGELALLLLRIFRSLDSIVGGDPKALKVWFYANNSHLGGIPAELVKSVAGVTHVANYLDAMRGAL
jgi:DNA-binding XRE family transcriptional regulator